MAPLRRPSGPLLRFQMSHLLILVTGLGLGASGCAADSRSTSAAGTKPSNVILFVVDDLGWGDLALQGLAQDRTAGGHAEFSTPHIDRLAREGVVLDNYYVLQLCSPTRSSLLSSRYAYHTGLGKGVITNGHPVALRLNESVMAEHFRAAGFSTHAFGKYDIGYHTWAHTPTERGFDHFLGYYNADEDYLTHMCGGCGCAAGIDLHRDLVPISDTSTYSTHLYSDGIVAAIKNSTTTPDVPFFIYAAYQAVHGPLEAPQQYVDACVAEGVMEADRLIFCGMVKALDDGVGNITAALEAAGLENDTLIALTTDNGGQNSVGGNNWPLRGNKATVFEGGVRGTGFFWGKGIERPGRRYDGLMHVVDMGPTLLSGSTGSALPFANASQRKDGVDQWAALSLAPGANHTSPRTEMLLNLFGPDNNDARTFSAYSALRIGDWKLVMAAPESPCTQGNMSGNACLKEATGWVHVNGSARIYNKPAADQVCDPGPCVFNLRSDPLEQHDLSGSTDPAAVAAKAQLLARLAEWNATRVPNQVYPCDMQSCPVHANGFWMPWLNSTPPMPTPGQLPATASSVDPALAVVSVGADTVVSLQGWVCDNSVPAKQSVPCDIHIRLDNATASAGVVTNNTIVRPKLVDDHFCADNHHGFAWQLNASQYPGVLSGTHLFMLSIVERATGERQQLHGCPLCLTDGKPAPCPPEVVVSGKRKPAGFAAWQEPTVSWAQHFFAWDSSYEWE